MEALRRSDLIIHAGDFVAHEVLQQVERYGPPVHAVHGNVDEPELKQVLPEMTTIGVGPGLNIGVIHDAGPARGRLQRLRARFPAADAVIFGHSHLPLQERAEDGFQIFNPGSPTERRLAPAKTIGIARAHGCRITFELVVVG